MISKNFMFQFVNNYFVLFYISILRPFYHPCQIEMALEDGDGSSGGTYIDSTMCVESDLPELQFQLMIVFTGKSMAQSVAQLLKPMLMKMFKQRIQEVRKRKSFMRCLFMRSTRLLVPSQARNKHKKR